MPGEWISENRESTASEKTRRRRRRRYVRRWDCVSSVTTQADSHLAPDTRRVPGVWPAAASAAAIATSSTTRCWQCSPRHRHHHRRPWCSRRLRSRVSALSAIPPTLARPTSPPNRRCDFRHTTVSLRCQYLHSCSLPKVLSCSLFLYCSWATCKS